LLGEYVALITLAESIRLISRFFIDTLLPALTNVIAARNMAGASAVFKTHMRILFLANTASTCGLILLARPITALLGPKYSGLAPLVVLLALFVGLSSPCAIAGALLSSIGKQQRAVGVAVGQIVLYVVLFLFLWPRWQLTGAVVAYGVAWVVSNFLYFEVAKAHSPFAISITREYGMFGAVATAAALVASKSEIGLVGGLLAWIVTIGLFLLLARYSIDECKELVHFFLPLKSVSRFLSTQPKSPLD
jgi:O-antigen/teichoic acid export membrane protein